VALSAAPATRTTVTADAASATSAAAADPNAKQHAEVVRRALRSGYQVSKRPDGSKRYCVEITHVGTLFPEKTCYTVDQLVEVFARQDLYQDQMHQFGVCGNAGCGGSN
jgi:hypothetical protein